MAVASVSRSHHLHLCAIEPAAYSSFNFRFFFFFQSQEVGASWEIPGASHTLECIRLTSRLGLA